MQFEQIEEERTSRNRYRCVASSVGAEQIAVPPDLPTVLKEYTKDVNLANPLALKLALRLAL